MTYEFQDTNIWLIAPISPAAYKYVTCSFRRQRKISHLEVKEMKEREEKKREGKKKRGGKWGEGRKYDFDQSEKQYTILKATAICSVGVRPSTLKRSPERKELMLGPAWRQTSCVSQAATATNLWTPFHSSRCGRLTSSFPARWVCCHGLWKCQVSSCAGTPEPNGHAQSLEPRLPFSLFKLFY